MVLIESGSTDRHCKLKPKSLFLPGHGIRRLAWESKDACQTKSLTVDAGLKRSTVRTNVG